MISVCRQIFQRKEQSTWIAYVFLSVFHLFFASLSSVASSVGNSIHNSDPVDVSVCIIGIISLIL